jgi:hypothetical protein
VVAKLSEDDILISFIRVRFSGERLEGSRIPPKNSYSVVDGGGKSGQNKDIA